MAGGFRSPLFFLGAASGSAAAPADGGVRSLLAPWAGGAGAPPTGAVVAGGTHSLLAPWLGGAGAPPTGAVVSGGVHSLLAFWAGGAAANDAVIPPEEPEEQGPVHYGGSGSDPTGRPVAFAKPPVPGVDYDALLRRALDELGRAEPPAEEPTQDDAPTVAGTPAFVVPPADLQPAVPAAPPQPSAEVLAFQPGAVHVPRPSGGVAYVVPLLQGQTPPEGAAVLRVDDQAYAVPGDFTDEEIVLFLLLTAE